jgi:hypothetical protein
MIRWATWSDKLPASDYLVQIDGGKQSVALSEDEVRVIGNAVIAELTEQLSIPRIRQAVGRAGFDTARIPGEDRRSSVVSAIQKLYGEMIPAQQLKVLPILASHMSAEIVNKLLRPHGYSFVDGNFAPLAAVDARELRFMPPNSVEQISTAFDRLSAGDEDGAIAAACSAVDTATITAYEKYGMGQPPESFQAKVNTVMARLKIYEEIETDLVQLGVKPESAREIASELHEATKHAANALQVIRRSLGDVHGKKPAYTRLTYDAIKWASAICGLLEGKV